MGDASLAFLIVELVDLGGLVGDSALLCVLRRTRHVVLINRVMVWLVIVCESFCGFGVVICLFTLLFVILQKLKRDSFMTYLVLRFSSIGNVAMTVPVVATLAREHPDDMFVYVSQKKLAAMFTGVGNVHFVEADFLGRHAGFGGLKRLYKEVTDVWKVDYVLDLQCSWKTVLFACFFRMRRKPVYSLCGGGCDKSDCVDGRCGVNGEIWRYADVFRHVGMHWRGDFQPYCTDPLLASRIQVMYGDKQGKWIGIAPFAKYKSNMLPYRLTKEVIAHFASQQGVRVFLFGAGRVESEMLRQWATIFTDVTCVAGNLRLEEEFELMRHLDVMLCMDSANQHLASLVGLRAVTIWGGTHPDSGYAGWRQQESDMLQVDVACRPCSVNGTNECSRGDFACLKHDVGHVISVVENCLKE